ncbi:MAG: cobalamin biosynthesis protein [Myxococcaceae bacterium]
MSLALVSLSTAGAWVSHRLEQRFAGAQLFVHETADWDGAAERFTSLLVLTRTLFTRFRGIIFVAPAGAVVRAVAPNLRHKTRDPAIVVVDVGGRFAVSLVSGHEGGANELAVAAANALGAEPVVTTTTEAAKDLIVGVGCRRGVAGERIVRAVKAALREAGFPLDRVRLLASADLKADEAGLWAASRELGVPLRLVASDEIRASKRSFARSALAQRKVNLPAVAEPAALLAGRRTQLALSRRVFDGVTVAIARESLPWSASAPEARSIGPGAPSRRSRRAR